MTDALRLTPVREAVFYKFAADNLTTLRGKKTLRRSLRHPLGISSGGFPKVVRSSGAGPAGTFSRMGLPRGRAPSDDPLFLSTGH